VATLEALYLQEPFWIWLAVGCLLVSLNLAAGRGLLIWPAAAAAAIAVLEAAGLRLGLLVEIPLFLLLSAGAVVAARRRSGAVREPAKPKPADPIAGRKIETERLIGRIGRTSGPFANGVGRVWIEGAEWAADLQGSEEILPDGTPVRVVKVIGGIRLQVQSLGFH
jgi:membrane protein implicated in regulation of membrane protease activity